MARYGDRDGRYYPPSTPIQVDGGIRARSRQGAIGETWWSKRFIAVLEEHEYGARLQRGRSYARRGQVLDLDVSSGRVTARVQGSRSRPYRVELKVKTLSDQDWERAELAMGERALFAAKLLAGEMPKEIEEAFAASGLSLFPERSGELASSCTCPDWANPCKHVAAVFYLLAEAFDSDPFLIFQWRGRTKAELLARLRALRRPDRPEAVQPAPAASAARPLGECLGSFWNAGPELVEVRSRPWAAVAPDAFVRGLGPVGVAIRGADLSDALASAMRAISAGAERIALGD